MLVELLIILLVLAIVFYIFTKYMSPPIPAPWGNWATVILAIIVIVFLLNLFLGLGL
jgi:membrane protein insertase Oxa1/YidC/SpoIIIJ